eukprot:TRINITY_DN8601_c0_g1_i1.p1 TRINITY_DN8601_c0_g1~~TRINITY_DN8601_c0_g1_i1.p1  ORF type:complete len:248 (+),score=41.24 TRINITY_DN8601_c0_g1_i1:116-859(+)
MEDLTAQFNRLLKNAKWAKEKEAELLSRIQEIAKEKNDLAAELEDAKKTAHNLKEELSKSYDEILFRNQERDDFVELEKRWKAENEALSKANLRWKLENQELSRNLEQQRSSYHEDLKKIQTELDTSKKHREYEQMRSNAIQSQLAFERDELATELQRLKGGSLQNLDLSQLNIILKELKAVKLKVKDRKSRLKEVVGKCVICLDDEATVASNRCGHCCLCPPCAKGLKKCPICQRDIGQTILIYKS